MQNSADDTTKESPISQSVETPYSFVRSNCTVSVPARRDGRLRQLDAAGLWHALIISNVLVRTAELEALD